MERDKALDVALGQIEKQFGKGSIMRMGEHVGVGVEAISTGAMALDLALGIGGLPRGRIVEIFGPESSGKSTLAMHVVAEAQRNGGICAYIDAEHAMDPVYAKSIGVDIDELLISQPDTGEQGLEIADMLVRSGAIDVVVIDSVAALTPRAEIEGEMGDSHVGLQARLMSQALRKLTGTLSKSRTIAVFINQLREKIGVMYGSNETTPGGRALKFYSSIRLDIRRVESLKDGAEIVGNRTRVKVVKNKCLAAGTGVFDPVTGTTHLIEEIVSGNAGGSVAAADKLGRLSSRPIVRRFDQGEAEVIGLGLRDGTTLWLTPDHRVLTETGWREAGDLAVGDRLARPRRFGSFGVAEPVTPDEARLLGYLIGDGYVGEKASIAFTNVHEELHEDASVVAASLGFRTTRRGRQGIEASFSHRPGEKSRLLELCRSAGMLGHLAPSKAIPAIFFADDVSAGVLGNLLFGLFETDGWVSREQAGGIRVGYSTTSEQLAHQLHWLLLRWGIGSSVRLCNPGQRRSRTMGGRQVQSKVAAFEVGVSGIDDIAKFIEAVPMWGPRGRALVPAFAEASVRRHRGSQRSYLPANQTEPVLAHLRDRGVTVAMATSVLGERAGSRATGLRQLLGASRLRRDHVERLADALDSSFLRGVLEEDIWYDRIVTIHPSEWRDVYDIEVADHHTFVANDIVVSNCAPPFRSAEFDIVYGKGISREGSVLDVAVDFGIVKKSGAWYTYEGEQLGQGRENAKQFLCSTPEMMVELDQRIRQTIAERNGMDLAGEPGALDDVPLGARLDDDEPITLG